MRMYSMEGREEKREQKTSIASRNSPKQVVLQYNPKRRWNM